MRKSEAGKRRPTCGNTCANVTHHAATSNDSVSLLLLRLPSSPALFQTRLALAAAFLRPSPSRLRSRQEEGPSRFVPPCGCFWIPLQSRTPAQRPPPRPRRRSSPGLFLRQVRFDPPAVWAMGVLLPIRFLLRSSLLRDSIFIPLNRPLSST